MKIAFIGGGNMGEAMLAAILKKKLAKPVDVCVSDVSAERRDYLKKKYKIAVTDKSKEAVRDRDIIMLAVKPQHINDVFDELKGALPPESLVLSIAAGIRIDTIYRGLGHQKIVRVMPNTPAQVGLGMSGWTATEAVTESQKEQAKAILRAMGKEIYFGEEKYLDMVTAVSGSGPAYFFLFTQCLAEAGVKIGLSPEDAEMLAAQTLLGSAQLLAESGESPAGLIRRVASKGGTTERALQAFGEGELAELVAKAVRAAYDRAVELGG